MARKGTEGRDRQIGGEKYERTSEEKWREIEREWKSKGKRDKDGDRDKLTQNRSQTQVFRVASSSLSRFP